MEKLLTVAVPSYNAEWCLDKCLSSFVTDPVSHKLEVIVVNDGSTDGTLKIAEKYAGKYPQVFKVIDKPNGGHGSGINAAIKAATGKYFKVVDADDWVVTENINEILNNLEGINSDAVICSFQTVNASSGRIISYYAGKYKKVINMDELMKRYKKIHPCCSIHGLMYLTETYRKADITITENVFYDDNEFAILPFSYVDSIFLCPAVFYQYRIGNVNQSVAAQSYVDRVEQLIKVAFKILDYIQMQKFICDTAKVYFEKKVSSIFITIYSTLFIRNENKENGRARADEVNILVRIKNYKVHNYNKLRYSVLRKLNRINMLSYAYNFFSDTYLYKDFRRLWGS